MSNFLDSNEEKYSVKIAQLGFDNAKNNSINIYTSEINLENTYILTWIKIEYIQNLKTYVLLYDNFIAGIYNFREMLFQALNNNLQLDVSIKKSLGFYQSQYYKNDNRKNLIYKESDEGNKYWIGSKYKLFDFNPASWLYNDKQGNILLEITPTYPWFFDKPEAGETFIKYSEWMKTYKPILVRTISKETAQQWLNQIDELIEVVKANDERIKCTGIGCLHCKKEGKTGCPCGS
jgi:hypothetical protein